MAKEPGHIFSLMEQLEVSLKNGEMKYGLRSNSDYSKRPQALQLQAIENEDLQQG